MNDTAPVPMGTFDWQRLILESDLPPGVRLTALALATYADGDGSRVWPGGRLLETATGRSHATVERHMAILRDRGWIIRTRAGHYRAGRADEYQLTVRLRQVYPQPGDKSGDNLDTPTVNEGTHIPHSEGPYPSPVQSISLTHAGPPTTYQPLPTTRSPFRGNSLRRRDEIVDGQIPMVVSIDGQGQPAPAPPPAWRRILAEIRRESAG